MNGPTIKAQYKDLYIGVMYLLSSNNYELVRTTIPYGKYETNVTSSATRTDIDVVIGYLLTPQLDVNAGYKGIFVSDAIAFTSSRGTFRPKHEEAYNLGTLGAGLHIPISTKATFLLNGNALLGTFDNTISTSGRIELISEDFRHSTAWGVSADTSVAYRMIENISGHIGLRWFFSKAGSDHSNLFGPTVGLDYLF